MVEENLDWTGAAEGLATAGEVEAHGGRERETGVCGDKAAGAC